MDKLGANFAYSLQSVKEKLHCSPLPLQLPIGAENDLRGIIDLIEKKAYYFTLGDMEEKCQEKNIPEEYLTEVERLRQDLIEKVIGYDEKLEDKYLRDEELSPSEIRSLVRQATLKGQHFPIFCGTAFKHVGIKFLLDGIVNYLPSPLDVPEVSTFSPNDKSKQNLVNCVSSDLSCLALAFKIVVDNYNNKLTFFRVYAGKVTANSYIYNVNRDKRERISRLVRMYANTKEEIKEVGAGDIAAAIGLENTITGDTFGEENNPLLLEAIDFAEPVITQAIEPKTNQDKDKLREALEKLKIQDPSFKY